MISTIASICLIDCVDKSVHCTAAYASSTVAVRQCQMRFSQTRKTKIIQSIDISVRERQKHKQLQTHTYQFDWPT